MKSQSSKELPNEKKNYKKNIGRSFSLILSSNRPKDMLLSDSFLTDGYQTNLERMIHALNKIKQKLILIKDNKLTDEIDWMVDTLLKKQLNDIVIKIEKIDEENTNKEEFKRLLELLAEFSSEFNFKRDIEKLQLSILNKKEKKNNEEINILKKLEMSGSFEIKSEIFENDFNIFNFVEQYSREDTLFHISRNIFNYYNLFEKIDQNTFKNFIEQIRIGYKQENPYHNDLHAADVAQTVSLILCKSKMDTILQLEQIDILSFIVSAICHDYKHTGQTNAFHVNMQTDLALQYNDKSVLENMHVFETFKILNKNSTNIFSNYSKDEYKLIRKRIIEMIMATDMSLHTKLFSNMKLKLEMLKIEKGNNIEKLIENVDSTSSKFDIQQDVLNYTLHAADLSHNVKSFEVTEKWTGLLMSEFWNQGDLEKMNNLSISFNCDRETANVPKSQISFLNGFIIPTFQIIVQMFPDTEFFLQNAQDNIDNWDQLSKEILLKSNFVKKTNSN
jgi:hypothetical protein